MISAKCNLVQSKRNNVDEDDDYDGDEEKKRGKKIKRKTKPKTQKIEQEKIENR